MTDARRRRSLIVRLALTALGIGVTVPVVVTVTGSTGGWDVTLGFVAGLAVAILGLVWVITDLGSVAGDEGAP